MRKLLTGLLLGMAMVAMAGTAALAEVRPLKMERAGVLPAGSFAIDAGLAFEKGREVQGLKYDNIRLAPLGVRFGLGDNFELGGFLAFSANSEDNPAGVPDESGLEGLTLFGKVALNPSVAVQFGITVGGDDDIAPYPNDGLDLFINVPMQRRLGPGLLYGQFGYRVQGGDFDNVTYFNYGVGYGLPLNNQVALNIELVGEENRSPAGFNIANSLDLVLGANITPAENLYIGPYISFGINDASPEVAIGGNLQVRF